MIDPHRLKVLVAVARGGTLAAAAELLQYSQPTISHHLARLEAETGAVLTQRVGRGLRLTEEGRRLVRRGEEILALLQRAEDELAAATSLQSGTVRLAVFPSAASTIVPSTLARMAELYPGISLELTEAEPPEARELLRAGMVDLALVFSYGDPGQEGFASHPLGDDNVHLVRPATGPLAGADRLEDHAASRWIAGCVQCRAELLELASKAGFEPQIGFATDDFVAVQHLVAGGFGVALLPSLALQAYQHPGVVVVPVPTSRRRLHSLTFGSPPNPPQVDAAIAVITQVRAGGARSVSHSTYSSDPSWRSP